MSYDLLAWNAWARNATPDEIAEKLTQQQAEVARLRSVCREAGKDVRTVSYWGIVDWDKVRSIAADLEQAGKEATDGQH